MDAVNARSPRSQRTNYVAEWLGRRIYPRVTDLAACRGELNDNICPFLSCATASRQTCVKAAASKGVCTISSCSNGPRQDWIVCPYRVLERTLLESVVRRLFSCPAATPLTIMPATVLGLSASRSQLVSALDAGGRGFVYLQDKLGGEISIARTARSPEMAFDMTIAEIVRAGNTCRVGRYGIFEVQTMDFHGSYRKVVKNLQDALRLHGSHFGQTLAANPAWLSEAIEGPNISNVFKRTFYQMMLKFQVAAHEPCVGCALAVPTAVWDSWQRHLAQPPLASRSEGTLELVAPGSAPLGSRVSAWFVVFDLDNDPGRTPDAICIRSTIATTAQAVSHYALTAAAEAALLPGGPVALIPQAIRERLATWWPELG